MEKTGGVYRGEEMVPNECFLQSEFYNDFLKPQNHRHLITGIVPEKPDNLTALSLIYSSEQTLSERELSQTKRILSSLASHICLADQLTREFLKNARKISSYETMFDCLPVGVLAIDGGLTIHRMNYVAERLLKLISSIKIRRRRLASDRPEVQRQFQSLVQKAICHRFESDFKPSPVGKVVLSDGAVNLEISSAPANGNIEWLSGADSHLAYLFVAVSQVGHSNAVDRACQTYGLSSGETKFSHAFVRYCDLAEAAESLHISMNTAKTHLKHIFDKTKCKKQAELVKLLLGGDDVSR